MSEWQEVELGSVCEIYDGPHATPPKQNSGFVFLGISSLGFDGRIDSSQFEYISEDLFKKWTKRVEPKHQDIVFSYETKLGVAAIIPKNFKCCLGRRMGLLRPKSNVIPGFLLYAYLAPEFQKTIHERTFHGSTVDRIPLKDMSSFPICLPPISEQKTIAAVLSSLDEKIDLLHRQNKTLEAMAETLFRQWFVEEVNEAWEIRPLGEFVTVKRGGSPRPIQEYLSEAGLRWLKISDATKTASPFIFEIKEHIKEEGLTKTTLLKSGTLVLSNSATPGIPKILQLDTCIHDGWLHFPKSHFSNEFLYLLFKKIRPELLNQGNGSIFTNLKTDILKEYPIPIADDESLQFFDDQVKPLFEKLLKNSTQIITLEKLRDNLLPKLMNGEVRLT